MFNIDSSERLKFLARDLVDHKFQHNLQDFVNPTCSCDQEIEISTHYLLHCFNYYCAGQTILKKANKIDSPVLKQNDQVITKALAFDKKNAKLKADQNKSY